MQVQFNVRFDGKNTMQSSEVAETLRRMAKDIEKEPTLDVGDEFGMRDANGNEVVWCNVEPDLGGDDSDDSDSDE